MVKPFKKLSTEIVLTTPIFNVRKDVATNPETDHTGAYYVLENPDWVVVIALSEAGELILIRQWRHGTGQEEVEFPAGLIDEGEDAATAAAANKLYKHLYTKLLNGEINDLKSAAFSFGVAEVEARQVIHGEDAVRDLQHVEQIHVQVRALLGELVPRFQVGEVVQHGDAHRLGRRRHELPHLVPQDGRPPIGPHLHGFISVWCGVDAGSVLLCCEFYLCVVGRRRRARASCVLRAAVSATMLPRRS